MRLQTRIMVSSPRSSDGLEEEVIPGHLDIVFVLVLVDHPEKGQPKTRSHQGGTKTDP
jgi:hypothetical protein